MKNQNIFEIDWGYLIILDACRFDFFKVIYDEYLEGKLEKRKSPGSNTGEWLTKTFDRQSVINKEITYISANPHINSEGTILKETNDAFDYNWSAKDCFSKIIDVWNFGWNKELKTVHPKQVTDAAMSVFDDNRKIIHYMQPHGPFLHPNYRGYGGLTTGRNRVLGKEDDDLEEEKDTLSQKIRDHIGELLKFAFKKKTVWKIRKSLDLPPYSIWERLVRNNKLFEVYMYNLKIALKWVSSLVNNLNGKTVVTADHGECLGEHDFFGHKANFHVPQLVEVPWLVIK